MTMDDALRVSLLRLDIGSSPPCRQDRTATAPTKTLKKRNHAVPELSHGQHQADSAAIKRIFHRHTAPPSRSRSGLGLVEGSLSSETEMPAVE